MRYGILLPSFWSGQTGRQIQEAGRDAVILAMYLTANDYANMIGLYRLPLSDIQQDLPVLATTVAISEALTWLDASTFAYYDPHSQFTWVREMARVRLDLKPGVSLTVDDRRRIGAASLYDRLPDNPFLGPFYDRYGRQLQLRARRGSTHGGGSPTGSGESPSNPLRGIESPSNPLQIPFSRLGTSTCTSGTDQRSGDQDQVRTHALAPEVLPTEEVRTRADRARARVSLPQRFGTSIAFENDVVSVPRLSHQRFLARLVNGGVTYADAEAQLFEWYPTAIAPFRGRVIADRDLDFWDARFAEWMSPVAGASSSASPRTIGSVVQHNAAFLARRRTVQ